MAHSIQLDESLQRFVSVRRQSVHLCEPLEIEDYGIQPMDDASPPKWHLAHTTWFFETFLLKAFMDDYRPFNERFEELYNSYYNGVGTPFPRPRRGMLSRPTVAEILDYRRHVDRGMEQLLERDIPEIHERVTLGLHHEQQHQELLLTDLKYNFGTNPLYPAYRSDLAPADETTVQPLRWIESPGGADHCGLDPEEGRFAFDNERPRHRCWIQPHALASRLSTNGEFLSFIKEGGYQDPRLWLADGWSVVQQRGWSHPLYWTERDGSWFEYCFDGLQPLNEAAPATHLSFYEADAFARWSGARLPTEQEWEATARDQPIEGNFRDNDRLHPNPASRPDQAQWYGDCWEWTISSYAPYPGYRPLPGTLGEYNGKFMSNQMVLRGGSCVTPLDHIRSTYRNFFYPPDRWQFSGVRLARDL